MRAQSNRHGLPGSFRTAFCRLLTQEAEFGAEKMVETGDFCGISVLLISIKTLSELPHQTGLQELKVVN
jgi:hypothetical protein